MMTNKERRYYLYVLVNYMMELDEFMKKLVLTSKGEEPLSASYIEFEFDLLGKKFADLADKNGKSYSHNDYFESDRKLQDIRGILFQVWITLASETHSYLIKDDSSGETMCTWNTNPTELDYKFLSRDMQRAYNELYELIKENNRDMEQESMEKYVLGNDLEEALVLNAILDYIGIFAFTIPVDYDILTFDRFENAVFGGICCSLNYDHNLYLAKNKEGKLIYATYKMDGQEKGYFVTVCYSKYLKRFEDIPSKGNHPIYSNTVICDNSLLTDWHFGRSNDETKTEDKQGKKKDEKIDDIIDDVYGNKKEKKRKEKKETDYKGIFSEILFIIKYPFIMLGKGFNFIWRKCKSLFSKIGKWFKKTFIDPIKIKKALNKTVYGDKKSKGYKTKNKESKFRFKLPEFRLPRFSLNWSPSVFLYLVPALVCFVVFLGYENGWFNISFFGDLNESIKFVDSYGSWAKGVEDWLAPNLEDAGTIGSLIVFIIFIPSMLIAYILEGIWWLISWVIIGLIKLLIFLIGNIVFIIPFLLYGGGIAMDVIMLIKSDKNASVIIGFALSMIFCITFGILIFI